MRSDAPIVVEDHSKVLAYWAERGVRNAVLINFDTHDDFRSIPEEKIGALRDLYGKREWGALSAADSLGDRSLYNLGSWIYAGARLGMFREVYWVIPFNYFSQTDPERPLRDLLLTSGVPPEDVRRFTLRNKQYRGSFRGIPVTLCGLEALPVIKQPVLLSIDTDFFPTYSEQYRQAYLEALYSTFTALFGREYRVQGAVVSYSINGDYLQPQLRWVGDVIAMVLRRPAFLKEGPPASIAALQQIDNLYRSADGAAMLAMIDQAFPSQPPPSALAYQAYAYLLLGDLGSALKSAQAGCARDRNYCAVLPHIAGILGAQGQRKMAGTFYAAGYSMDPSLKNGLFHYALALERAGSLREALVYYRKDAAANGSFPVEFLIYRLLLRLGEPEPALAALRTAIENLEQYPEYKEVENRPTADAIYQAIDYCNKNGLKELSARLDSSPVVRKMFKEYPRPAERSGHRTGGLAN